MEAVPALLGNRYVAGALAGAGAAALVDFEAFRSWRSFNEALAYEWGVAAWRWFQGAVVGVVTAAGIEGLS